MTNVVINVDNTAPQIVFNNPGPGQWVNLIMEVNVSIWDDMGNGDSDTYEWRIDNGGVFECRQLTRAGSHDKLQAIRWFVKVCNVSGHWRYCLTTFEVIGKGSSWRESTCNN